MAQSIRCLIDLFEGISIKLIWRPTVHPKSHYWVKKMIKTAQKYILRGNDFYKLLLFSDETKINLFFGDGKRYIRRERKTGLAKKNIILTVKHEGRSVVFWQCFSLEGMGELRAIGCIMDKWVYLDILKSNLRETLNRTAKRNCVFQLENDPKDTSKVCKDFFVKRNVPVLEWPSQSLIRAQ